jgi:hypothetical protein
MGNAGTDAGEVEDLEFRMKNMRRNKMAGIFFERGMPDLGLCHILPEVFRRWRQQTGGRFFKLTGAASPSVPTIFPPSRSPIATSPQCSVWASP